MSACLKCGNECENKYCSANCFNKHKKQKASRCCLCCGKTWYRKDGSRKQPKGKASIRFHNAFCSRKCAWRYKNAESDRKARCVTCRKPTGMAAVTKCVQCRSGDEWEKAIRSALRRAVRIEKCDPWMVKIASLIRINEFRGETSRRVTTHLVIGVNEKRGSVVKWGCHYLDVCSRLLKVERQKIGKCPWARAIHNRLRSQSQRMERKACMKSRQRLRVNEQN